MKHKLSLPERIDAALAGKPMDSDALAHKLWPVEDHPRAWKIACGGGPPGLVMALGAALRRGGFKVDVNGPGPGCRVVWPRRKR